MAYSVPEFPTKKALREAVKSGTPVRVFSERDGSAKTSGTTVVEAPRDFHRYYAAVTIRDGVVVGVK